ncbi:replicative helicase loader/inhibitor [Paenibacillus sp. FSL H3-0310]|uniref:replicative helicase loader/inhibitor n=1 Tax=Paenibacillus sp. FSL H3-0310 TaxID=2921429 RepID=UPI0030F87758
MKRAEVIELLVRIAEEYSQVDTSDSEIDRLYEHLKDFPFDVASENVRQHILTNTYPPKIAQIRGKHGDLKEHTREKLEAAHFLAEMEAAQADIISPPPGWKEKINGILGNKRVTE